MDDTNQNPQLDNQQQSQGQQSVQAPVVQPTQHVPAGSVNKEQGPVVVGQESISRSTPEVDISQELKEAGVEAASEVQPELPHEPIYKTGMQHAGPNVPVTTTSSGSIKLPLTYEEALEDKKTSKPKDSKFWRAELIIEQIRKLFAIQKEI